MSFRRLVLAVSVIVLMAAGYRIFLKPATPPQVQAASAVPVHVQTVRQSNVPVYARAVGRVQAGHRITVRPQLDAILLHLPVAEGKDVQQGDLLAQLDDRQIQAQIAQYQAQKAVLQAQLELAELELKRYRDLQGRQAISEQELDRQQAQVRQLQASLDNMDAAISAQKVQLSYTRIQSPISGRVGIRNVHEGNVVRTSDSLPMLTVVQLDPLEVVFSLPQRLLPQLQALVDAETPAEVLVYAGDDKDLLAQGQLSVVDNQVARSSGTIQVKAVVENRERRLWPEQAVTVALQLAVLDGALTVPQRAVRQGAEQSFVWRIREGRAESVPVTLVHSDAQQAVVEGLEADDQIVVDGYSRLMQGSPVQVLSLPGTGE